DSPLIRGGSLIAGPLGALLAEPVYGREAVLTADLDLADLTRARYDFDATGHYARPDVFSLQVDTGPRAAVVPIGQSQAEDADVTARDVAAEYADSRTGLPCPAIVLARGEDLVLQAATRRRRESMSAWAAATAWAFWSGPRFTPSARTNS